MNGFIIPASEGMPFYGRIILAFIGEVRLMRPAFRRTLLEKISVSPLVASLFLVRPGMETSVTKRFLKERLLFCLIIILIKSL